MDTSTTTEAAILNPGWGLKPEPGAIVAWGARAIYKSYPVDVDLLGDRMGMAGGNKVDRRCLADWINKVGLKLLKEQCATRGIRGDSEEVVRIEAGDFVLVASPRASHGYLYIGVWLQKRASQEY